MMVETRNTTGAHKRPTIYLDMDGVLARFEQAHNAMERFIKENDFFETLEPTEFAKKLRDNMLEDMYILTSSPHEAADQAKRNWVAKHLPQLKDKVITVRSGEAKALYAKGNILVDDYTENLEHWVKRGGKAVKALNGINGKTLRYKTLTNKEIRVD